MTITLAHPELIDALRAGPLATGVHLVHWDLREPLPDGVEDADVDAVVVPNYFVRPEGFAALHRLPHLRLVQLPSAGYEHALPHLPTGIVVCNGRGVHDAGTAELAVGLTLAAQRGIGDSARAMADALWAPVYRSSLADRRVMVLGYGSVGSAIARRLEPFEVEVVRVARTARESPEGWVHGVEELAGLLPTVDVVIVIVPLTTRTLGLVDAQFLARLPDGALVVNVARGKVVDTGALLGELTTGRLRAALDVTDPEPLPADHPLWRAPNLILTPHVGGCTDATVPRLTALVRRQLDLLTAGLDPVNVVART